ncbi:MAG: hypothetical protein LBL79_11240 [Prevotella sp.]|jgi:hypothetical protein|nr:hypothetical protein [Prevotella sp.]
MKKLNLYVLVLVSLFFSCQSDEGEYEKVNPTLKLEFTYNEVLYSSAYHYSSDSIPIFNDEKVRVVYYKLMENEQLATVVNEDGKVTYYDDFESVEKCLPQPLTTKSTSGASLSLYLYEDEDYKGSVYSYNGIFQIDVPDLGNPNKIGIPLNLNDMITSIVANFSCVKSQWVSLPSGASLTIFEHIDYNTKKSGKSLTLKSGFTSNTPTGVSGQIKISTLQPYVLKSGGLFSHSVRWNDQMSSAKFTFYKDI